jgi:peptidyl-prolyl cis-trans isomerase NIMA-interacting 1
VSRRTGETVALSPDEAMEELRDYERRIHEETTGSSSGQDLGSIFSKYAKERSDCSSYKQGGDLGFFGPGQMQRSFEEASFALAPETMSGIVSSDSGYHLIYRIV